MKASFEWQSINEDIGEAFTSYVFGIVQDVARDTERGMLGELQAPVPKRSFPADYPIEWTSERQRRAYFASNGFGAGIPYQRTGQLQESWQWRESIADEVYDMSIETEWLNARFVVGTLSQDMDEAQRPMQRFHRITGWQPAGVTVWQWFGRARDAILERAGDELGDLSKFVFVETR
jgi:hypothetical protein